MRQVVTIIVAGLLATSAVASAQGLELGGMVASACVGSDGSICDDSEGRHVAWTGAARWWVSPRFDLGLSVGRMGLSSSDTLLFPEPTALRITDRSRTFLSGIATYHFVANAPVRPMVGLGLGMFAHRQSVSCDPGPCPVLVSTLEPYRESRNLADLILVVGLSGDAGPRWTWRAGLQSHRFGNDENSTHQLFAGVGYRLGQRPP